MLRTAGQPLSCPRSSAATCVAWRTTLKPLIRLGNAGLTEAVATETARALSRPRAHQGERRPGGDREARDALFTDLAQRTASALVHRIGNVAVLYRPNATLQAHRDSGLRRCREPLYS